MRGRTNVRTAVASGAIALAAMAAATAMASHSAAVAQAPALLMHDAVAPDANHQPTL